jgi:C1A family cysteine protease
VLCVVWCVARSNSWAADWGENGYIYVSTKEAKGNLCGILDEVNYANATKATIDY